MELVILFKGLLQWVPHYINRICFYCKENEQKAPEWRALRHYPSKISLCKLFFLSVRIGRTCCD